MLVVDQLHSMLALLPQVLGSRDGPAAGVRHAYCSLIQRQYIVTVFRLHYHVLGFLQVVTARCPVCRSNWEADQSCVGRSG
jgi:hypothetical protein